ncbi:Homeobox-leucine zipper protein HDG2 [Raphanus sativus]|uniref:Homeobox-leucine zipper protein HDG2 n=1 Tax=Raphanus sativus TaxID=3726 RepID=A0A6J0NJP0_RAPSA|nr:homeobox-leucine zipper protein HDG2 [Raphanus sativus]XP_056865437.1 homeobox-leucine zipper protein HDG2 [Raphanus sativus]XP_056865438.1 homeobox-leucine zipper protein HDG2 [Raphanus sativus]XP_056865439.1 homeobox-leucine zipper protein HDG2 [Raphanus sativus]XP_056865440.1 homeobox-leucine zipper protein HDG2 [Raphanus sativus]XP_056865441.1 homeobox-leucine zipper protein HDG2 [Raphanus sativus]XP_056865442.1 homeobox-leucine zipper protein HDG2 [Raphanus sativus]XP_056865443.1 hom
MSQPNMVPVEMNNNVGDNTTTNNNSMNGGIVFGDGEFDSANTSENQEDGSDHQDPARPSKRKRYHRHTKHQIQEMENFFKECPHPDDAQRKDLSRQLGLDHHQIKFWFQNKRTQIKNHQERHENLQLRAENDRLKAEHHQCRASIPNARCHKCGGKTAIGEMFIEEHQLRLENARLAEEIRQLSLVVAKCTSKPVMNYTLTTPPVPARPFEGIASNRREAYGSIGNLPGSALRVRDVDKPLIKELAVVAMEELIAMARLDEPLWNIRANGTSLALNLNEYTRTFGNVVGPILNGFRTEASKATSIVFMNHLDIVQSLMDVNLWSNMFARMVARSMSHDLILTEVQGNFDGAFHLMTAEYQVLSPVVSTRECYFVRYSKQRGDGIWAVVDVSIEHLFPHLELKCRRRPSGCLIQQLENGYCKVTWVEHVEVDDGEVHPLYKSLISSGQALSAESWVETLERQCERLAYIMAPNVPSIEPDGLIMITNIAKQSLMKIAERMTRSFLSGVANSAGDTWFKLPGNTGNPVRVMARKSFNDPGRPVGVILYASTSFWLPVSPNTVFDFLRDANNRTYWDVITTGGEAVQLMSQISNGRDIRNCVSLLRTQNTSQNNKMMIQETSTDPTASFVIYAPLDVTLIENVLKGGDPDYVSLLPMGFAILPDGTAQHGREGGSLVSASFQVLVETDPLATLSFISVATTENLILTTVNKIKAYFNQQPF